IEEARADSKPSLICCRTVIGKGSPNKGGSESCHGAPLGEDEVAATRDALGWQYAPFEVPDHVYAGWDARERGAQLEAAWEEAMGAFDAAHPELSAELRRRLAGELPADFSAEAEAYVRRCQQEGASVASRKASQNCLNAYGPLLPELIGGSADLAGSNLTLWSGSRAVTADDAGGNYLYYGVREFGMAAIMNGIALHGGFINYGATFLIFMEYARNAVRMAALMKQQSIFVFTHDSIGLGEDGPTHQAVEQLVALRATPNMHTWRPCDTVESAVAWKCAIERRDGPAALIFSRQGLPHQDRDDGQVASIERGAYVLRDCEGAPEAILIATGSEVALAVAAAQQLQEKGRRVRVVSMPCAEVFEAQDAAYREAVLPSDVLARVAVEALHADFWYKYVGLDGRIVGMTSFGESAPGPELMRHFGFTEDNVVAVVEDIL
ncbi:MAG: transketolase, partial [Halioglobus sp.]|nr:transketolase [Halioglobus sp.]